jgi:hypothetical protein
VCILWPAFHLLFLSADCSFLCSKQHVIWDFQLQDCTQDHIPEDLGLVFTAIRTKNLAHFCRICFVLCLGCSIFTVWRFLFACIEPVLLGTLVVILFYCLLSHFCYQMLGHITVWHTSASDYLYSGFNKRWCMISIQAHIAFNTDSSLNLHTHTDTRCNLYYEPEGQECLLHS